MLESVIKNKPCVVVDNSSLHESMRIRAAFTLATGINEDDSTIFSRSSSDTTNSNRNRDEEPPCTAVYYP